MFIVFSLSLSKNHTSTYQRNRPSCAEWAKNPKEDQKNKTSLKVIPMILTKSLHSPLYFLLFKKKTPSNTLTNLALKLLWINRRILINKNSCLCVRCRWLPLCFRRWPNWVRSCYWMFSRSVYMRQISTEIHVLKTWNSHNMVAFRENYIYGMFAFNSRLWNLHIMKEAANWSCPPPQYKLTLK